MSCLCLEMAARPAEGNLWGAAEGYKGEKAPEGADVYTVNNNGGPGGADDPFASVSFILMPVTSWNNIVKTAQSLRDAPSELFSESHLKDFISLQVCGM